MKNTPLQPTDSPILHLDKWASEKPNEVALDGPHLRLTWKEMHEQVRVLAAFLIEQKVNPGTGVIIHATPELARVYSLAVLRAGLFSGDLTDQHDPDHIFEIGFRYTLSATPGTVLRGLEAIHIPTTLGAKDTNLEDHLSPQLEQADLVRVVFSSGTTGSPKAIPFSLAVLGERVRIASTEYMTQVPFLNLLSYKTVSGNTAFFLDLFRGSTHFVPGTPKYNLDLIRKRGIRGAMCSPSSLELLVREAEKQQPDNVLEIVQSAGGFVSSSLATRAATSLGCAVVNIYGSTEAGLITHSSTGSEDPTLAAEPYPGVEIKILDENGLESKPGSIGEVAVKTPYQVDQYLGDPQESAKRFRNGFFFSGDLGYLDQDGLLHLSGRNDDVINHHGQKINPQPIEAEAISKFGLDEAVCVLVTDQNDRQLHVMFVVAKEKVDPVQIKDHLYAVYRTNAPQRIMQRDSLPRNEMGKVLRRLIL